MVKFSNIKDRYNIIPQMRNYDQISYEYKPFIMFFNCSNYKSKVVNTDEIGFRLNYHNNNLETLSNFFNQENVTIVIGGSLVFGFGATSDNNTISSILSKKTNKIYLNFGGTAFNSKQEILLFLNFFQNFKKIDKVIIVSGANDLYLNLINDEDEWGNFFFKKKYQDIFDRYKNRNNFYYKFNYLLNKFKKQNNNTKIYKVNFTKLYNNYSQNLKLWSNLSNSFDFKIHFFLQPLAIWTKKKLSDEEEKIFNILDNSNDLAHIILKETSKIENYLKFSKMLESLSKEINIDFTDLNFKLNQSKNLNKSLFVDRIHMNDLGYNEISKLILDNI
tara:strand:+ start:192 stop:1187 length:996 start_codon:yes stop_codon:yes gene_type:complete